MLFGIDLSWVERHSVEGEYFFSHKSRKHHTSRCFSNWCTLRLCTSDSITTLSHPRCLEVARILYNETRLLTRPDAPSIVAL